jgi:acyl-CoA thioester hydrolase
MELRVRYAETDQMKVVHHARYFEWFECGRSNLMRQIGYPYKVMEEEGFYLPIIEVGCRYYSPATYDDLVQIKTEIRERPRAKIRLDYLVSRLPGNELLVEGFTIHAFLDHLGKPCKPNRKFIESLKPYF